MAEPDLAKEIIATDVMTGGRDRSRFLYYQLKLSMRKADKIDIIVSFLMESGVRMLQKDLKAALDRGAQVRILTGNYLGITQPSALYLIKMQLGDQVDLRFYQDKKRSFHPKAYIFHYGDMGEIYIGSSNISRSALTSGIEWNHRFSSLEDQEDLRLFCETFEDLFAHHSIVIDDQELARYSKNWHRPAVSKDLARYDALGEDEERDVDIADTDRDIVDADAASTDGIDTDKHVADTGGTTADADIDGMAAETDIAAADRAGTNAGRHKVAALFQPRGAQIEALYALENSRAEGAVKGLVQAATGIGKTYLAAFDSARYQRVLFVAHREEILKQAAVAFRNVRRSEDYGFFNGGQKDWDKAVIFASVATLGREEYLREAFFAPDYFDYLVIDEFHHAVNDRYRRIIAYFRPKFLLGLTATPERLDGRDIYQICDYNVPYEISLKEAINKGMLVPFHYYGIYDETDYSSLHRTKGRYDEEALNAAYIGNKKRYDLIERYYRKYRSKRALGFCCSRQHAEEMAGEFCRRGIPAAAVYSNADGAFSEDRDKAIQRLKDQELRVIFSVDMFNEGVDIAPLDMVMFLRPTESPVVFLQQLGRGLRTSKGKTYLNVLDFIGNYEKAGRAPWLLSGEKSAGERALQDYAGIEYPDDCIVDFDLRLIDLFREMEKRSLSVKGRIRQEFYRVKDLLDGKVPTRMELSAHMEEEVYQYCIKHPKENPFRRYMDLLKELGELSAEEERIYGGIGREFLSLIETTDMQKVYKMPILYSFYNDGDVRAAVTDAEVLESWKRFFDNGTNWKDFADGMTYEAYQAMTDRQHLRKAKDMPIRFLKASGKGFFVEKEGYALALREELKAVIGEKAFQEQMKDILAYRTMAYHRRRYAEGTKGL